METPSSSSTESFSPIARFIVESVEPMRDELNEWTSPKAHTRLLLDAAKRRKLTPKKIGWTKVDTYGLMNSGKILGGIYGRVTSLASEQAMRATSTLNLAQRHLALSGIPYLTAKAFHVSHFSSAESFMNQLGGAVSIRVPSSKTMSRSEENLLSREDFYRGWERLTDAVGSLPPLRQVIEVEQYLPWVSLRTYVVGEQCVAAVARVPLYVVGDGREPLVSLAGVELTRRSSIGYLPDLEVQSVQSILAKAGKDPNHVPGRGEVQLLSYGRSGQFGLGWSIDITDTMDAELKTLAVDAVWAFPGLGASAVDILAPQLDDPTGAVVTGVRPAANLQEFRYPAFGTARFPNRDIIAKISTQGAPS